jgi:hypothetical protein
LDRGASGQPSVDEAPGFKQQTASHRKAFSSRRKEIRVMVAILVTSYNRKEAATLAIVLISRAMEFWRGTGLDSAEN